MPAILERRAPQPPYPRTAEFGQSRAVTALADHWPVHTRRLRAGGLLHQKDLAAQPSSRLSISNKSDAADDQCAAACFPSLLFSSRKTGMQSVAANASNR